MKQYLFRLKDLIKRGILRIFPLPKVVLYLSALVVACTLIGCATPKRIYGELGRTTQLVEHVSKDTVYLSNTQYDSIYVLQDKYTDRSKDTLLIKETNIEFRYKLLKDTVRIVQRDSIPYEVIVTEIKEITRPLTWFDKASRLCFFLVIVIVIVIVARPIIRLILKIRKL